MSQNRTTATEADVVTFMAGVENDRRRGDAAVLLDIMRRVTGVDPRMWGPSIIGFGRYHYRYETGREGESLRVGFSPRKTNLVLYLTAQDAQLAERMTALGKFRSGASCLYVNKLADVDLTVLEELVSRSWQLAEQQYGPNQQ
jgi:hypothetical protein